MEIEVRRDVSERLTGAAAVSHGKDGLGIALVGDGPGPPDVLDALSGIHQDAVEIEEDRVAVKAGNVRLRRMVADDPA